MSTINEVPRQQRSPQAEGTPATAVSQRAAGKVVVVTGAAGGIGSAACRRLVAAGARVVCADIDLDAVRSLAASLGDAAIAVRCDVSRAEDAEAASRAAQEAFGSLTGLVNNAAAFVRDATVETIAIDDWRRTIDVNITGAMLMSRFAVPRMRQAGGGSIIHMASQLGHVGKAGRTWYCTAKAGLIQLAKTMAIDHAADHIRVNSVSPGPIATERIIHNIGGPEAARAYYAQRVLTGNAGTPDDIAHAVVYLISDESAYMTGADLLIDGGYTAV